jgi:hypothetical protein
METRCRQQWLQVVGSEHEEHIYEGNANEKSV